jgi:hypothetical protein
MVWQISWIYFDLIRIWASEFSLPHLNSDLDMVLCDSDVEINVTSRVCFPYRLLLRFGPLNSGHILVGMEETFLFLRFGLLIEGCHI